MGIFGPSYEETRLQSELDVANSKLKATEADLKTSRETVDSLLDTANGDRDTIIGLRRELADNKAANTVAEYVVKVLEEMEADGEIDFGAEETAKQIVMERTVAQVTASITDELIDAEYTRLAAEIEPDLAQIRAEQYDRLTHDGTFTSLEAKVGKDARAAAMQETLAEKRAAEEAKWQTPEAQAMLRAEVEADKGFMKLVEEISDKAYRAATHTQREQMRAEAPKLAKAEVAKSYDEALAKFMKEWPETWDGRDQIAVLKQKLAKQVEKWGKAEILAKTEDEELLKLAAKREEQLKADLQTEILLHDFTRGGADSSKITAGSRLEIYLGSTEGEVIETNRYGDNIVKKERNIVAKRYLRLAALGDGKFTVVHDSLSDAKSIYEKNDAIADGTVIIIGHQQIENGAASLQPTIIHDVPLFYDADTTNEVFTETHLKVQAIRLNDTLAADDKVKVINLPDGTTEKIKK